MSECTHSIVTQFSFVDDGQPAGLWACRCGKRFEPLTPLTIAAPELLEALTRVMLWIDNWSPEFTNDADWPIDRDAARAAISKATT